MELPESLDGTYERILQDIDKANWKFALRLFHCVTVASRPLHVEELAEFLAFDFDAGSTPTFQADWRPEDPINAVLSTCPNFLSIVNVEGSTIIQFSHFSVKEYLTSNRLTETGGIISRYHVSMNPAHTIMAQACLTILLHLDEAVTNDTLKNFPLAEYAARNWADHARFDNVSASIQDGLKRLFDPRRPHLTIMVWIHDPEIPWLSRSKRPSKPGGNCLHYATLSGLPDLVKFLVTEFTLDLNTRCYLDDFTPLHLASRDGHVETARVLVEHGADVNARDISKRTPLRLALDNNHVEIAQVLIENRAYIGPQGKPWMPLHRASGNGQAGIVQVLLEHGADASARDENNLTPLQVALKGRHMEVARVLREFDADASAKDKSNNTSLHRASERGDVDVALVLLEHGAYASAQDKDNLTPLHWASECGHVEVARVLLEHDAVGLRAVP
jgi:ankyrin repeat protein